MHRFIRAIKFGPAILTVAVTLASGTSQSYAGTGTVRIRIAKTGFIVGVGGGSAVLPFKGKNYRLRVDGISGGFMNVSQQPLIDLLSSIEARSGRENNWNPITAAEMAVSSLRFQLETV